MAWITVPGLAGKVYEPDDAGQKEKKHPCRACFSCQWCDETRCRVCRDELQAADCPASSRCGRRRSSSSKTDCP